MRFSFSSKKKNKPTLELIIDIGSASVGAALVLLYKDDKPKIVYSKRKNMVFQEELNTERFQASMLKVLNDVVQDVQMNGLPHLKFTQLGSHVPTKIHCTLSSPWYASQTRVSIRSGKTPFVVTKEIINGMVEEELKAFNSSDEVKTMLGKQDSILIDKSILSTKINGYETNNPFNKKGVSLELATLMSVSPKKLLENISDEISRHFLTEDLEFNSFPVVSFAVVHNIYPEESRFLFLDISGELTDVTIVKDGIIRETATFPMGKKNIIRILARELKTTPDEALSILHLYNKHDVSAKQKKIIEPTLQNVSLKWLEQFQKVLFDLSKQVSLSSSVYFTSDKDLEDWFGSLISEEQFSQFTMTDEVFAVHPLNAIVLNEYIRFGREVERDAFLSLEAIFANISNNLN